MIGYQGHSRRIITGVHHFGTNALVCLHANYLSQLGSLKVLINVQAQMIHQIQDDQVMGPPSLAESRPNAYIPEDLGIPKPYGGFAPFKPSDPGSSMRHIRVPNPREIVI